METRTPQSWYEREMRQLQLLVDADIEPIQMFTCGKGHILLLAIADGLRALQVFALSHHRPVVLTGDTEQG
jgi:hypothetical protein